jgi:hypothetical protein
VRGHRGAASNRTRPAARTSRQPVQVISAATTSEATASARTQPVTTITIPAANVARNAHRSVSRWASTPRTFRLDRFARPASQVASRFTATPTIATTPTTPPCTDWTGLTSRRTPSTANQVASSSSVMPLSWPDSVSTRVKPYVYAPCAGRRAIRAAITATPMAAASVTMWPASVISASECARTPAVTSPAMNSTITTSAASSQRRSVRAVTAWACAWSWLTPPACRIDGTDSVVQTSGRPSLDRSRRS